MMTRKNIHPLTRHSYVLFSLAIAAILVLAGHGSGRLSVLAQGGNPVSVENALTGDTDWDVFDIGDPTIQGFATNISVNRGETVDFKINTNSSNYTINIYRLGYYGGAGARKVATVAPSAALPQTQPLCLSVPATGLVDCGNWAVSASWNTTGAVSGIYVAKMIRVDTGGASHIVFIVRDDARRADIVVQTSDTTWQAYNRYGGASLYCAPAGIGVSNAGTAYACANRATKVSYNRPFDTRLVSNGSWLFSAEYPMLRFLEANGYDVKYWAGVDTDRRGADLVNPALKPKLFVSSGHDEYWSGNQRTQVENARNAGVHLAFFSGNEVYWKTRYEPSIDGLNTAYRTLVTYKETLAGAKIDPDAAWTGTWRDPRFSPPADGGRPENALTGSIWTVNSGTSAITVPAAMANLRFWRNTRVAGLTSGVATLMSETLGYEWNEDLDNGARPAGLMHLSATTVSGVEKIIDYGTAVANGTATHHLTLHRHSSGALVFGAGTIQWGWGLDASHDGGSPAAHVPDQAIQQATVNLLGDMGVQPATLQVGADPSRPLVASGASTDVVPPTSIITAPAVGAQVQSGAPVTITGTATDSGGGAPASVEVSIDGGATWQPAQGTSTWTFNGFFGVLGPATIKSRAIDDSGNVETPSSGVSVTVIAGTCPCTTIFRPTTVPAVPSASDTSALELGVKFKSDVSGFITGIRFYKGPTNTGTHIGNLWSVNGTRLASVTFTGETATGWQQANFAAPVSITANTVYVASYHTNVGGYSSDGGYFASAGVDSPPLHAVASLPGGGNGVFRYGASMFPSNTFNATNYYVDVVFAESTVDTTGPIISQIRTTAIDGSNAVITWKTNETANSRIEYSTSPSLVPAQTVADSAFVIDHSLALTNLTPNATYYFRITSVDPFANAAVALAPSFTMPGQTLRDTASVDFQAGTLDANTYVSQTGNGEVILKPAVGTEFSGATLPAGWIEVPFNSQGYSIVDGGALLVDGARVATCVTDGNGVCLPETAASTPSAIFSPPRSLEFVANFSGDRFQHAGLAQTLWTLSEPWAVFSTSTIGSTLFARTNTGSQILETSLGTSLLGSWHRYRIDWQQTRVDYYVDGVAVATHNVPTLVGPLRPIAASDFDPFGGNIFVDWMRMSPYAAAGTFVSRVFDAGAAVNWATIAWTGVTPPGTSLAISVRTGNTPIPDASWSSFAPIATPGPFAGTSRYVQYRADLATTDPATTPRLEDIIITADRAPVAVDDAATTTQNTSRTFLASPSNPSSLVFNDTDADTPKAQLRVNAVSAPAHGTATLNANGSVTYTPATGYTGADSFSYTITDGLLTSNAATVSITVINAPPVAVDDGSIAAPAYTVNEDSILVVLASGRITANDSSQDPAPLTAVLVTDALHGHVTLNSDGSFTYTPNANTNGLDQFTYQARDTSGALSNIATVYIGVTPVNDAPSFTKGSDQVLFGAAGAQTVPGWAANISAGPADEAGQTLTFIVTTNNNALFSVPPAVSANGTLTYTPAANIAGSATVTVQLQDNGGTANGGVDTSAAQTFIIRVTPTISIGDVMLAEGDSGTTTFSFPVTLSGATDQPVVVYYSTLDGTATVASGDYQAASGVVAFAPGVTTQFANVLVNGDTLNEDDETFTVTLFNAAGATLKKAQGAGVILNDDPVPSLTISDASQLEGNAGTTDMTFTVTISHVSGKTVKVNYATANGSAVAPADYVAQSGTVTFAPGTPTQTIAVPVVGNTIDTPNKTFVVNLSSAVNATIASAQATGTIIDDDTSTQTYTTAADFSAGTLGGSYIAQTADGEVILAPTVGTEFSGTSLPAGWISTQKITGGSVTISNGTAKLQGTQISTTTLYGAGRSVEFAATFNGAPQQSAGLLLAQFYTQQVGTTVNLYAATVTVPPVLTLIPGNWFNASHKFRIDWNATSVVYWIDGAKVATHNVTFPAVTKMSVIANDFWKSDGVITIDWMRLTPYAASDAYTSQVFDAGAIVTWLTMSWSANKPTGTNVVVSYRRGNTPTPDATWTAFTAVSSSGSALSGASRYFQYMIQETTTALGQTPAVNDVTIGFNR